jgi:hypothetical protein
MAVCSADSRAVTKDVVLVVNLVESWVVGKAVQKADLRVLLTVVTKAV